MEKFDLEELSQLEALTEYLRSAEGAQEMLDNGYPRRTGTNGMNKQPQNTNYMYNPTFRFGLSLVVFACSLVAFNNHEVFFG